MERRNKKQTRGRETNSIRLQSSEERKGDSLFNPNLPKGTRHKELDDEDRIKSRVSKAFERPEFSARGKEPLMTDGFVVKDSGEEKYYVIKNNGLVADYGKQEYSTVTDEIRTIPFTVRDPTSNLVTLLRSPFKDRMETFYFPYPDFCIEEKQEGGRVIRIEQDEFESCRAYFRYDTNIHIYNSVIRAWNEAGLFLKDKKLLTKYRYMQQKEKKEIHSDEKNKGEYDRIAEQYLSMSDRELKDDHPYDTNIRFWISCKKEDLMNVRKYCKINHFPYSYYLGRKDQLYRIYQVQEDLFHDDYNFMPKTYIFPTDAGKFHEARDNALYQTGTKKKYWIFKPTASSCGRGIRVINSSAKIPEENKGFLISEYITSPHLIDGLKYDLRVYVLVTSYDPLLIYIYNDGIVRFWTEKYRMDEHSLDNKMVHLSNYSIQKGKNFYF